VDKVYILIRHLDGGGIRPSCAFKTADAAIERGKQLESTDLNSGAIETDPDTIQLSVWEVDLK